MTKTYSVVYRTGGTLQCTWRRVFTVFTSESDALAQAAQIERAGYRAVVHETAHLNSIGLPIGWEPHSVDYERDKIECDRYVSRWTSSELLR